MLKTISRLKMVVALLAICLLLCPSAYGGDRAKNIIVLIADGCSSEQVTFARWAKGGPLSLDGIRVGALKTYVADSVIANSAPAASAFATGVRTSDKFISIGPQEKTLSGVPMPSQDLQYRPLATILEGARLMKKATGIVATSRVTHATPAAYMAHVPRRDMENDIMEQAVYQGIDVVFGGGERHLLPVEAKGKRTDGENLIEVLKGRGYQIVGTRDEMMHVEKGPVFGMFASSHMDAEIDRPTEHPLQPTLMEMTKKAIDILSRNPDGFFLMVEGSQIDWACHAHDPAHLKSDLLAFDDAVRVALNYAREDGNTLLLALSDHNTGGFTIGNDKISKGYASLDIETLLDPILKMRSSSMALWKRVENNPTTMILKKVVKTEWGMAISKKDAQEILDLAEIYKGKHLPPHFAIGKVLCPKYTALGWTTHGHTGGDVPLYAYGPGRPIGLVDGPEIGKICSRVMGLNLENLNKRLFVEAGRSFPPGHVKVDKSDETNPVVQIEFEKKTVEFPVNKNILKTGDHIKTLEGVVVYIPEKDRVYIPMEAVNLIKGKTGALPPVSE